MSAGKIAAESKGMEAKHAAKAVPSDLTIKKVFCELDVTVPFSGGSPAYLEIDKLPDGRYRATVGTLFEFQELCRTGDLEGLLRHTRAVKASNAGTG